MKLALIRHGQTPANITASLDTRLPGLPLTELGLSQAESLKERFVREVARRDQDLCGSLRSVDARRFFTSYARC